MTCDESLAREAQILWLVSWWPEDWPVTSQPCKSYIVAETAHAALLAFSSHPGDWVAVERVGNGGVYIVGSTA
jgi:hypothetical protein